ncbi:hypothetical protein D3C73_606200 [compost metagenome]
MRTGRNIFLVPAMTCLRTRRFTAVWAITKIMLPGIMTSSLLARPKTSIRLIMGTFISSVWIVLISLNLKIIHTAWER